MSVVNVSPEVWNFCDVTTIRTLRIIGYLGFGHLLNNPGTVIGAASVGRLLSAATDCRSVRESSRVRKEILKLN